MVDAAPAGIPEGFASSNGRIEATEVDIATKTAGRIDTILVKEGQFVARATLARMDTRVLNEQRLEAAAQIKEAESAIAAASPARPAPKRNARYGSGGEAAAGGAKLLG
jgi:HlyD family secretion protein